MNTEVYDFFGLNKKATEYEIKKAYRKKSKKIHPDMGGSKEEFNKTNKYYKILMDPRSRKEYDETGNINENKEKDERVSHLEILAHIFETVLMATQNLETTDIFDVMRSTIKQMITKFNNEIKTTEESNKKIKQVIKRIKKKRKKEENIFANILHQKEYLNNQAIKKFEDEIKYHKEALKYLEDFDYEVDTGIVQIRISPFGTIEDPNGDIILKEFMKGMGL